MYELTGGHLTARPLLMALGVVVAGLAAAVALATATHQRTTPPEPSLRPLTELTLATKPHGHAKPFPNAVRLSPVASP